MNSHLDKKNENKNNGNGGKEQNKLHIFINKIKFDEGQGVKDPMTGGELADLVSVPRENAKITRQRGNKEFSIIDTIDIKMADHFEILRKVVPAGHGQ
jgi:hypothetical protein